MSDQRLRELDRAARHDPAAAARLDVELVRAGHDLCVVGRHDLAIVMSVIVGPSIEVRPGPRAGEVVCRRCGRPP